MEKTIILLASASPRRTALLKQAGIPHIVMPCAVDEESIARTVEPSELAHRLARLKVEACLGVEKSTGSRFVLGADTVVTIGRRVLGKPRDEAEAESFLRLLSGATHRVVTAVCLYDRADASFLEDASTTLVRFVTIDTADMGAYLATGEWQGVAGGYRIQGRGACFIREIRGSYTGVVGLPLHLIYGMLKAKHYPL